MPRRDSERSRSRERRPSRQSTSSSTSSYRHPPPTTPRRQSSSNTYVYDTTYTYTVRSPPTTTTMYPTNNPSARPKAPSRSATTPINPSRSSSKPTPNTNPSSTIKEPPEPSKPLYHQTFKSATTSSSLTLPNLTRRIENLRTRFPNSFIATWPLTLVHAYSVHIDFCDRLHAYIRSTFTPLPNDAYTPAISEYDTACRVLLWALTNRSDGYFELCIRQGRGQEEKLSLGEYGPLVRRDKLEEYIYDLGLQRSRGRFMEMVQWYLCELAGIAGTWLSDAQLLFVVAERVELAKKSYSETETGGNGGGGGGKEKSKMREYREISDRLDCLRTSNAILRAIRAGAGQNPWLLTAPRPDKTPAEIIGESNVSVSRAADMQELDDAQDLWEAENGVVFVGPQVADLSVQDRRVRYTFEGLGEANEKKDGKVDERLEKNVEIYLRHASMSNVPTLGWFRDYEMKMRSGRNEDRKTM